MEKLNMIFNRIENVSFICVLFPLRIEESIWLSQILLMQVERRNTERVRGLDHFLSPAKITGEAQHLFIVVRRNGDSDVARWKCEKENYF